LPQSTTVLWGRPDTNHSSAIASRLEWPGAANRAVLASIAPSSFNIIGRTFLLEVRPSTLQELLRPIVSFNSTLWNANHKDKMVSSFCLRIFRRPKTGQLQDTQKRRVHDIHMTTLCTWSAWLAAMLNDTIAPILPDHMHFPQIQADGHRGEITLHALFS